MEFSRTWAENPLSCGTILSIAGPGIDLVIDFAERAFHGAADGDGISSTDLSKIEDVLRGGRSAGGFFIGEGRTFRERP